MVTRQMVRELLEQKGPKARQALPAGEDWSFHYAVFARAGFTEAAAAELSARQGLVETYRRWMRYCQIKQ